MIVDFDNKKLLNYYQKKYKGKQKYNENILVLFRQTVKIFIRVSNFEILYKFKGLRIEKLKGKKEYSARLSKRIRLHFLFFKPNRIIIKEISKHYEKN